MITYTLLLSAPFTRIILKCENDEICLQVLKKAKTAKEKHLKKNENNLLLKDNASEFNVLTMRIKFIVLMQKYLCIFDSFYRMKSICVNLIQRFCKFRLATTSDWGWIICLISLKINRHLKKKEIKLVHQIKSRINLIRLPFRGTWILSNFCSFNIIYRFNDKNNFPTKLLKESYLKKKFYILERLILNHYQKRELSLSLSPQLILLISLTSKNALSATVRINLWIQKLLKRSLITNLLI